MTISKRGVLAPAGLAGSALLLAAPAQAHHLMEIMNLQATPLNGLLSGLAHPVIGPDHLVFLLALSLVGLRARANWMLGLLAVGLAGTGLGLLLPGLPGAELLVALSLAAEALVVLGRLPVQVLVPAMALHGYVLSASVLGWTAMPVGTYLLGLLLSQGALLLVSLLALQNTASALRPAVRRVLAALLIGLSAAGSAAALLA
jgi:urease accessory protein